MGIDRIWKTSAAVLAVCAWVAPAPARACGGTFCDGAGATPMPVDQTGENVLFIQDGPSIEAHIQIQYTGEPQRFAWLVPVPSVPEFSIGSDLLFQELLRASAPSYAIPFTQPASCAEDILPFLAILPAALVAPYSTAAMLSALALGALGGCGGADLASAEALTQDAASATVVYQDSVGAFDITVLQASTTQEVTQWLADNDYNVPPGTAALVRQYVEENSLFAAVKLVSNARVDQIHPIVLRYDFGVPCVPLRLTAVAASSDMGVRVFFLSSNRVVPKKYRHVVLNPARVDWLTSGSNYKEAVSRAVDDDAAAGKAFVTEYAGTSTVALSANILWWSLTGAQIANHPADAVRQLENAGLMTCATGTTLTNRPAAVAGNTAADSCTFFHPLIRGLLQQYVPPPAGTTELAWWGGDLQAAQLGTPALFAWDRGLFAMDFDYRVALPARDASRQLESHPYLTRMFTTISPEEMTVDPEFHERSDLPTVPNRLVATAVAHCDGFTTVSLPDRRAVEVPSGGGWPAFTDAMPWAMLVEESDVGQQMVTLADRTAAVDTQLASWNGQRKQSPLNCACSTTTAITPGWAVGALVLAYIRRRSRA